MRLIINLRLKITKITAIKEAIPPALIISIHLTPLEEKAMAFGGVEIGKAIAREQDKDTAIAKNNGLSPGMLTAMGISKLAEAVSLINVDRSRANKQKIAIKIIP